MVGTLKSRYIRELVKAKKIDASLLEGKNEKYLMTVVSAPLNGVDEALVIVGSDKRGTIYGIYELSEQIGVSPWYDWADVPVMPRQNLSMTRGSYRHIILDIRPFHLFHAEHAFKIDNMGVGTVDTCRFVNAVQIKG